MEVAKLDILKHVRKLHFKKTNEALSDYLRAWDAIALFVEDVPRLLERLEVGHLNKRMFYTLNEAMNAIIKAKGVLHDRIYKYSGK